MTWNTERYDWDAWEHDDYSQLDRLAEAWKLKHVKRIYAKIAVGTPEECWEWQGALSTSGYGVVSVWGHNIYVHRITYEMQHGPIPERLFVDHLCRNTRCVNPNHLEAVTPAENNRRGDSASGRNARKTHCPAGHLYDESNTRVRPTGRQCRACARERMRRSA